MAVLPVDLLRFWLIMVMIVLCFWFTGEFIVVWFYPKGIIAKIPLGMSIQICKLNCCLF